MTNIQVFNNTEFGELRIIEQDSESRFVGKDAAEAPGYSNPRDALSKHVEAEDKNAVAICDAVGRMQNTPIINESGMRRLFWMFAREEKRENAGGMFELQPSLALFQQFCKHHNRQQDNKKQNIHFSSLLSLAGFRFRDNICGPEIPNAIFSNNFPILTNHSKQHKTRITELIAAGRKCDNSVCDCRSNAADEAGAAYGSAHPFLKIVPRTKINLPCVILHTDHISCKNLNHIILLRRQ